MLRKLASAINPFMRARREPAAPSAAVKPAAPRVVPEHERQGIAHSFSCLCEDCLAYTAALTAARLKATT